MADTIERSLKGELIASDGTAISPANILIPFVNRNAEPRNASLTPYIPAMIYEMSRPEGPSSTLDFVFGHDAKLPTPYFLVSGSVALMATFKVAPTRWAALATH